MSETGAVCLFCRQPQGRQGILLIFGMESSCLVIMGICNCGV